jgi:alanyl-tRNA synthetase
MTARLYYDDSYCHQFEARIVAAEAEGREVFLDRTKFYPASGGQPFDTGWLNGFPVVEVIDEGDRIRHRIDGQLNGGPVTGLVDAGRRFDHMQQHTGQHLLSAVLAESFGLETVSFHLGSETSTIDLAASSLPSETIEAAESRANAEITRNRAITVTYEDAASAAGLRKVSERSGVLRIVTIDGLDRSACGGTHVRATGEIGLLLLTKTEKVRQTVRLEFVCGERSRRMVRRGQETARTQIAQLQERAAELDKERRRLAIELAGYRGRDLCANAAELGVGRLAVVESASLDEVVRAEATAFVQAGRGAYLAVSGRAVLLAASSGLGIEAGAFLKPFLEKGGGSAAIAQGTLAGAMTVADIESALRAMLAKPVE